jgi:hypothetical protein
LYVTREIRLRGDVAELGRADDGIGEAELHAIHEVEGFKAELEVDGVVAKSLIAERSSSRDTGERSAAAERGTLPSSNAWLSRKAAELK